MRALRQLKLLLWKNYTLQKRRPIATIFQLCLPLLFVLILLLLRVFKIKEENIGATVWNGFRPLKIPFDPPNKAKQWQIAYAPINVNTTKIMTEVSKLLSVSLKNGAFDTERDMVNALLNDQEQGTSRGKFIAGIVFQNDLRMHDISYKIRMPSALRNEKNQTSKKFQNFQRNFGESWHTKTVFPLTFQGVGPRNNKSASGGQPDYYREGFLGIQYAIDIALTVFKADNLTSEELLSQTKVDIQRFPYPRYLKDPFVLVIQISLPLLIMLSLVYTALVTVKSIVYEKERKLKESMKIMGLNGYLHWIAWFIESFLFLLIPMAIITVMLTVEFGSNGKMLNKSDPSLIFVYLVLYSMSSIMYWFMVSTIFSRANIAAAGGGISWFASYVPYFFLAMYYNLLNTPQKTAACLDFNVAMAFGAFLIGNFEGQGTGVQWSNLYQGVTVDDSFSFGAVLMMMFIDCFIYGIIMWYIEAVFPGEFSIPQPWYFPFKKSYWCSRPEKPDRESSETSLGDITSKDGEAESRSAFLEKEPEGVKPGIQMMNLKKVFDTGSGEKVAVDGINLNMYEGQITALLGHNGAGKTTTISMLTGLFPPTSGNAFVNGYDILNNIVGVRESLGICPQHNVLFDALTVEEHLWFFATLKGMDEPKEIKEAVDHMISAVGLDDKRDVLTVKLSGGMKRKLSVGIALIGDSKIVILDEPTSGMDPAARRFTWDLLQKERPGRTILLTTHFMDEADLLGDRIAIMANGTVQCCGSSLFLKNKYGVGYHMVIVKGEKCKVQNITDLVLQFVPTAKLENDVGLELSYVLPSEHSKSFEALFTNLEENKESLGISSYGASVTTLEEVFLKVKEEESSNASADTLSGKLYRQLSTKSQDAKNPVLNSNVPDDTLHQQSTSPIPMELGSSTGSSSYKRNTGCKLFMQRWRAMFMKRLFHSKRYKAAIVSQLVMPGIWTLLAMIVAKMFPQPTDSPARVLSAEMFKDNNVLFSQLGRSTKEQELAEFYIKQFSETSTKIMNVSQLDRGNLTSYILDKSVGNIGTFNAKYLFALSLNADTISSKSVTATAWFNNAAYHSIAVSLNAVDNTIFQYFTKSRGRITAINHPLPRTTSQSIDDQSRNSVGFNVSFNILFGMAFLASSFVIFLVQERASKAKHLQFVSGVGPFCYWTATFAWDVINFSVTVVLVVIIFAAFQTPAYSGERLGYVVLLLVMYGWAIIPLIYLSSFLFSVPSTAFIRLTIFNVITGLATLLTVFILSVPSLDLLDVAKALKWAFLVLPNYALGQALNDMFTNHQYIDIYHKGVNSCVEMLKKMHFPNPEKFCESMVAKLLKNSPNHIVFQTNYLAWDSPGVGRYLVFLAWEGLLFFSLVLLVEYGVFSRRSCKGLKKGKTVHEEIPSADQKPLVPMDEDVAAEMQRIDASSGTYNDVLVLDNVTKYYGTIGKRFLAVDHISLGIPHGECFGLLGLNGAGKTTTFKMITGDESLSEGSISVDGFDVDTQMNKVRQCMGYCPQFDALIDLMTGRELLTMYARLRGIPENEIPRIVEDLAASLTFDEHIDKVSKSYSGGNKRKLSTAMALVGDPTVLFLDEPTTGMDPAARRMLWDALTRYRQGENSIVITSHSMEECEALCTRLAVMVNGQFKCLGSPQHLKSKFGEGYSLLARVGGRSPDTVPLKQFIHKNFPGSLLKDEHQGMVHYQLKDASKSWAKVFAVMEKAKEEFNIDDYSVSQTTLEQVFLNFARYQMEDERTLQNP